MTTRTYQLKAAGQSLWLDNIQRRELHNGALQKMIDMDGICGITSNPTIFMNAVSKSTDYDDQISQLAGRGAAPEAVYHAVTVQDIRDAGKLLLPVYEQTAHADGFVSIELNPQLAFKVQESITQARALIAEIGLPNIMIKVPGTKEGLLVVRQLLTEGINVNITLLFDPERYRQVAHTYIEALEARMQQGKTLADIHSVASFFISRIDTRVDAGLDRLSPGSPLRGKAAIQVAKVTYTIFKELFFSERFKKIAAAGGRIQRVLWASTGTKDPAYSDVLYVDTLIGPHTINTLPPKTIDAFRVHGVVAQTIETGIDKAPGILAQIEAAGVSLANVYADLEAEGVQAFETSYLDLLKAIADKAGSLAGGA
ncbi:MAG: transaldolase [Deltaproteobacteria bacterium]|nr:transaldolase [Deltaproteobacteria bacterium]